MCVHCGNIHLKTDRDDEQHQHAGEGGSVGHGVDTDTQGDTH